MPAPGYSGTPLAKKLGYKEGLRVWLDAAPDEYRAWLEPLPTNVEFLNSAGTGINLVHLFVTEAADLKRKLAKYLKRIAQDGAIWVSWPKKASKVPTDIAEDTIREICLPMGLVDVKVCAVSDVWSGLKLVIRKEVRTG